MEGKCFPGTAWRNTEYRSFRFLDHHIRSTTNTTTTSSSSSSSSNPNLNPNPISHGRLDDHDHENATLRETADSRRRRGKVDPPSGPEQQAELFKAALHGWAGPDPLEKKAADDEKGGREEEDDDEEEEEENEENEETKGGQAPATDRTSDAHRDRDSDPDPDRAG